METGKKFRAIRLLDRYATKAEYIISGIFYTIMIIDVFIGVILRYVTHTSNLIGEEVSRYSMIGLVFFSVACACREGAHMNVQMFVERFPAKMSHVIKMIVRALVIVIYALMAYLGFQMVMQIKGFGQVSPAMRLPLWIMYAVIACGFLLGFIAEVLLFANNYLLKGEVLEESGKEAEE